MKQQPTARMPKAGIIILALSLIALVLFAGHSETGPPPAAAQNQLVWESDGQPDINENSEPTSGNKDSQLSQEFAPALTEEISTAADTDLWRLDDVYVEGYVCNGPSRQEHGAFGLRSLSLVCDGEFSPYGIRAVHAEGTMWIDYPDLLQGGQPAVFTAEAAGSMTWELTDSTKQGKATFSLGQHVSEKGLALLNLCHYDESVQKYGGATGSAEMQIGRQTCSYDSGVDFSRKNEVNIKFDLWAKAGDYYGFSMYGVSGRVTLTYKRCPDPNDCKPPDIARLGAEVIAPVVEYMGEEVPVGEMFFPETCPLPDGRSADDCASIIEMKNRAALYTKCVSNMAERLQALIQLIDFSKDKDMDMHMKQVVVYLANKKIAENCTLPRAATGDYELGLVLAQGAILLNNVLDGQTVDVSTPAGSAGTGKVGGFLTAYNPDTATATFQSHGAPLTVRPKTGPTLVLQPNQQVVVTSAGAGPVENLPHLYLPVQVR